MKEADRENNQRIEAETRELLSDAGLGSCHPRLRRHQLQMGIASIVGQLPRNLAGFPHPYNLNLGTSTQGLLFTIVTVTGGGSTQTFANAPSPPAITALQQFGLNLLANTNYTVRVAGTSPNAAGEWHGGITINAGPVPEPATWAMMLLGFGGIGMAMRRGRRLKLAQVA